MTRILLASNGSGYQIDKCLQFDSFRDSVAALVSDRACGALAVAEKHGVEVITLPYRDSTEFNAALLSTAIALRSDFIISPGFTRIFRGDTLHHYANRIFNCHPSILPAFKGFYDTRDAERNIPARKIFERVLDFGARITGNTIHTVTENIDEGHPVLVSSMNIPYGEDPGLTRHRLFIQECQCLLQL